MRLTIDQLRVECRTTAPLVLPEFTGSALRGALLGVLRDQFCPDRGRADCAPCPFAGICPVSRLIATVDEKASRGDEAPRPYVLRPVEAASRALGPGEHFSFLLALVGDASSSFPYLLQALRGMGEAGFGLRQRASGTFRLERIIACNPYIAAEQTVYERGRPAVYAPSLGITQTHVSGHASLMPSNGIGLHLRSPLRLVAGGSLVRRLSMAVLMRRLLRRLTDLCTHFSPEPLQADFAPLLQTAEAVRLVEDQTRWVDLESHSGRSGRRTPIGGLTGHVRFEGNLAPLLPYLGWLPFVGLGKEGQRLD